MSAPHAVLKNFSAKSKRLGLAALTGGIWRAQSSNRHLATLGVPAVAVGSVG